MLLENIIHRLVMSFRKSIPFIVILVGASISPQAVQADSETPLVAQAILEYKAGRLDRAVELLAQDLRDNPDNGTAHYYLGCALKKLGKDSTAVSELAAAARLCPPGVIQVLAKQVIDEGQAQAAKQPASTKKAGAVGLIGPLLSSAGSNHWHLPAMPSISAMSPNISPGNGVRQEPNQSPVSSLFFSMFQMNPSIRSIPGMGSLSLPPDLLNSMHDLVKRGKEWTNSNVTAIQQSLSGHRKRPASAIGSGRLPDEIPMAEMLALVEASHGAPLQSSNDGVIRYEQSPEHSQSWANWIILFKREFNIRLFKHLAMSARHETGGTASAIFSVDKEGHLRGCVYEGSADDNLKSCVLQTIRELEKSPFVVFPPDTKLTGWNFRIRWNFERSLAYINAVKARLAAARLEERLAAARAADSGTLTELKTDARLAKNGEKLGITATSAKLQGASDPLQKADQTPQIKTRVSALLLPKPKPVQLKAVPLKLPNVPPAPSKHKPNPNQKEPDAGNPEKAGLETLKSISDPEVIQSIENGAIYQ